MTEEFKEKLATSINRGGWGKENVEEALPLIDEYIKETSITFKDLFLGHINMLIDFHKEREDVKSQHKDYTQALYHNYSKSALGDLLIWIKHQK